MLQGAFERHTLPARVPTQAPRILDPRRPPVFSIHAGPPYFDPRRPPVFSIQDLAECCSAAAPTCAVQGGRRLRHPGVMLVAVASPAPPHCTAARREVFPFLLGSDNVMASFDRKGG